MVIAVEHHKIGYLALPKAACTSVKQALAHLDPAVEVPDKAKTLDWHAIYPTTRFNWRDWKRHKGYFRFCVLRDPVKRLMSCYTDIVAARGALKHSPRVRASAALSLTPDPDMFFENLAAYREASSLVRTHSQKARLFLGSKLSRYDRVYTTATLDRLGADLSGLTGQSVRIPKSNRTGMTLTLDDLGTRARECLAAHLEDDYTLLSDFYANPFHGSLHRPCAVPAPCVS